MLKPKPYSRNLAKRSGIKAAGIRALTQPVATTADGRDITRPYMQGLLQPRDPRLLGAIDWGVYDKILEDDQVFSSLQQRRNAIVSREWEVTPGDADDPRSVEAADALRANLRRIGWDRVTGKMLYSVFHGIAVAELLWEPKDGLLQFGAIKVRHARRFRYDDNDDLQMLTRSNMQGELMPARKFWVVTSGASDDDEPFGRGLAEWLYWPTLFKRNGVRFWNNFIDKFSSPTAMGKYRPGTPLPEINKLLDALAAISTDSGIAIPDGMAVELLQVAKSGTNDFEKICRYMDEAIIKILLSQTMTSLDGASLSQAQVHDSVKLEVMKADADEQADSFNIGPARWFTDLNFGVEVASPLVTRTVEAEKDLQVQATTDEILMRQGWVRTEESFQEIYGDGYERGEPLQTVQDEKKVGAENGTASFAEPDFVKIDPADSSIETLIASEGRKAAGAMTGDIFTRIAAAETAEDIEEILADSLSGMDEGPLRESLNRAAFALRLEEENGEAVQELGYA